MAIDLNTLVPSLLDVGFELASQIAFSGTYTARSANSYDPSTGANTPTLQTATVTVLPGNFTSEEAERLDVQEGDKKMVIREDEMTAISTVRLQDTITDATGKVWQVVWFMEDPTRSVLIFQVRKLNT